MMNNKLTSLFCKMKSSLLRSADYTILQTNSGDLSQITRATTRETSQFFANILGTLAIMVV